MSRTKEFLKRISILLCIVLTITMLPAVPVSAADEYTFRATSNISAPVLRTSASSLPTFTKVSCDYPNNDFRFTTSTDSFLRGWQRLVNAETNEWEDFTGKFVPGVYRFKNTITDYYCVYNAKNPVHLPESGFKVYVNDILWEPGEYVHDSDKTEYQYFYSPMYTITPAPNYEVSFENGTNGTTYGKGKGTMPDSQTVNNGETPVRPANPSSYYSGGTYYFVDWFTASSGSAFFDFDVAYNEDTVVYAHWSTQKRTITFNLEGAINCISHNSS